jgi:hypothetical protein
VEADNEPFGSQDQVGWKSLTRGVSYDFASGQLSGLNYMGFSQRMPEASREDPPGGGCNDARMSVGCNLYPLEGSRLSAYLGAIELLEEFHPVGRP